MWAKMAGKVAVLGKIGDLIANSASELGNFLVFVQCLTLCIVN